MPSHDSELDDMLQGIKNKRRPAAPSGGAALTALAEEKAQKKSKQIRNVKGYGSVCWGLPIELRKALKVKSGITGKTMNELAVEILTDALKPEFADLWEPSSK